MATYLLDTNILVRLSNEDDPQHLESRRAIQKLKGDGARLCLMYQVMIEFWVVATRPVEQNGLGWMPQHARQSIDELQEVFELLGDPTDLFRNWLDLVTRVQVCGKRAHDARIAAFAQCGKIDYVLTFNRSDFDGLGINAREPAEVVALHDP